MTNEKKLEDFLPNKNKSYYKKFDFEDDAVLISKDEIIKCIKTVMDPEIPVNIYDLGLIYDVKVNQENVVEIKMTLTTPNCPVAESLPKEVEDSVKGIKEVKDAKLELVWEPPWDKSMMSEAAKLELNL